MLARLLVRLAAAVVPAAARREWRQEWLAELAAIHRARRSPLRFTAGAPLHAFALRLDACRPSTLIDDLRFAFRLLRRRPLFAVTAVGTLAIGIAASTAIFSVAYGVLFKPLPYRDPDGLVQIWEVNPLFNWTEAEVAPGNLISWRERNGVFADIAYYLAGANRRGGLADLTLGGDEPSRIRAAQVSPNFFEVLGVPPSHGRAFRPGDDVPGQHRLVVLSDRFWRRRLGARADAAGAALLLNGSRWTVIGVMPAGFVFEDPDIDVWIPLAIDAAAARRARQPHIFRAIARLKDGVTVARAHADLTRIASDLEREFPETNRQMSVGVGPLDDWMVGRSRQPLLLVLAGVGLVLLVACANVANLQIVRATERVRELTVRVALGAGRARLVRQLLAESGVLAIVATAVAVPIADLSVRAFVARAPITFPRVTEIGLHPAVLLFSLAAAFVTTMLVGLAPAVGATRRNLGPALAEARRGQAPVRARLTRAIVAFEVASAVVLLTAAGMNARSLRALVTLDLGFDPVGLTSARLALPVTRYADAPRQAAFFEELAARLRADPRVQGAGATSGLPVTGGLWTGDLFIERQPDVHARDLRHRSITSGYLEALRLPLIAGRSIRSTDIADQPLVVVINQTLAGRYFAGQDPIGQRIAFDPPRPGLRWRTIVGVAADEPQQGLGMPVAPQVFDAEGQETMRGMTVVVRSTAPSDEIARLLRETIRAMDPHLAMAEVGPFADDLRRVLAPQRLTVLLTATFGLIALTLAAIGVSGVVAYAVTARAREIGVRVACGARAGDVLRLMIREHMRVVAVGLVVGTAAAVAAASIVGASLFGVPRHDVASAAAGAGVLAVVALIACTVPARRVYRIDPVRVLKGD